MCHKTKKLKIKGKNMNLIKRFFEWILGWVMIGAVMLVIGWGINTFGGSSDTNQTKKTKKTTISKDEKLIEIRKEYWDNGNLKSEVPYKKSYGIGWKKVKTKLVPHGIAKQYYETGILEKEDPYINGVRTGVVKLYDKEGHISISAEFKNDKQNGKTIYFDTDGSIIEEEYYKDGNLTMAPKEVTDEI